MKEHKDKYVSTLEVRSFINVNRSVLYGMMLGDATVNPRGRRSFFRIKHGAKQEAYMLHKYEILKPMVRMQPKLLGGQHPQWYFETAPDVEWQKLWSIFHENSKKQMMPDGTSVIYKTVNSGILDVLDDRALAFWIMDDGTLYHRPKPRVDGSGFTSFQFSICTLGFTKDENDLIAKWIGDKYEVRTKVYLQKCKLSDGSVKTYYRLFLNWADYQEKVAPRIKPYIIPSMAYKLPPLQDKGRPGRLLGSHLKPGSMMRSNLTSDRESHPEMDGRQALPGHESNSDAVASSQA